MIRRFLVALAVLLPLAASATCTWTSYGQTEATVVCTTANEAAPSGATVGMDFSYCQKGVDVFVYADSGQTLSGSGTIKVYAYEPNVALWGEVPDLAMSPTVSGARAQGFAGIWTVVGRGRFAIVPVSVGVSSGGFSARITCN